MTGVQEWRIERMDALVGILLPGAIRHMAVVEDHRHKVIAAVIEVAAHATQEIEAEVLRWEEQSLKSEKQTA